MCGWQLLICREAHCSESHDEKIIVKELLNRGPDEQIIFHGDGFRAIFTRLSIRELRGGVQPFLFENYVTMGNGELYNTAEISAKLEFKYPGIDVPNGDMQLLGVGVSKDGAEILRIADGFYSGVSIDTKLRFVKLFRDKVGEKPLVYFLDQKHFLASTNPGSCEPVLQIESEQIPKFLACGFWTNRTSPFSGIARVLPGEIVSFDLNNWSIEHKTYWNWPESNSNLISPSGSKLNQELSSSVLNQVSEAVRRQLVSDVPIACLLSGGIDSTVIATLATKLLGRPIKAFTLGFRERSFDESQIACQNAEFLDLEHEVYFPTEEDYLDSIPNVLGNMKMPILDPACISLFLLTKFIGRSFKVCMTGDGGDEVFRGYEIYKQASRINLVLSNEALRRCTLFLMRLGVQIPSFSSRSEKSYINWKMKFQRSVSILENPDLDSAIVSLSPVSGVKELAGILREVPAQENETLSQKGIDNLYRNFILPRVYAEKADRMSMANSIELRAPFLSPILIEALEPFDSYLKSLSKWEVLSPVFSERQKQILKSRPKHGFMPPIHQFIWNFELSTDIIKIAGLDTRSYGKIRKRVQAGDQNASLAYWALIVMDYFLQISGQHS